MMSRRSAGKVGSHSLSEIICPEIAFHDAFMLDAVGQSQQVSIVQ